MKQPDQEYPGAMSGEILPATSLLICSRERPELLLDTVNSVLAGSHLPEEIVIVDQSARPHAHFGETVARTGCALRYLHSRSKGLSLARNEAIAASRCPLIAIIDDDMYVRADCLINLFSALKQGGPRTVVTGQVLPAGGADATGFVPALVTSHEAATYRGRLDRDVLAGGHMAAFRSAFHQVGGFDVRLGAGSRYPAADDNDLGLRLLEAGFEIRYVPEAVVYHRAWRPQGEYLPMRWRYGLGKGGFYAKHAFADRSVAQGSRESMRSHMRRRLVRDIGRRALGFRRRLAADPRGAAGDMVYSLGVVIGAARWLLTDRP